MVKRIVVYGGIIVLSFSCGMFWGNFLKKNQETVTIAAPEKIEKTNHIVSPTFSPKPTEKVASVEEKEDYLLMLSGDSISIYALKKDGTTDLIEKKSIDPMQLRQEDYEKLCRGVTVNTLDDAKSLCEDFGG